MYQFLTISTNDLWTLGRPRARSNWKARQEQNGRLSAAVISAGLEGLLPVPPVHWIRNMNGTRIEVRRNEIATAEGTFGPGSSNLFICSTSIIWW